MLRTLIAAVVISGLLVLATGLWIRHALLPVEPETEVAATRGFVIESGDTLGRVARRLEADGFVHDARVTRWYAQAKNLADQLKVGEYELSTSLSTPQILETLARGRVRTHAVVIPEGIRASEIADRLAEAGLADREAFLAVVFDPDTPARFGVEGPSLEGYLFPDTYRFARGLPPERIAQEMVDEFLANYHELDGVGDAHGLSMREFVTLASIVEKETGVAEERPLIAAVFLNRLKRGMRLETDPTVIYGIEGFDGNLRRVHLEDQTNPYNTYRIRGLPPGPIASPGHDALRAVREPAESPFLYFVSRNDGTHVFSKTYSEHAAAVDRFQRRVRRR